MHYNIFNNNLRNIQYTFLEKLGIMKNKNKILERNTYKLQIRVKRLQFYKTKKKNSHNLN